MPISVLLVDDHTLVRQGLKLLLSQDPEIRIVGEAANGLQALEQVAKLLPDEPVANYPSLDDWGWDPEGMSYVLPHQWGNSARSILGLFEPYTQVGVRSWAAEMEMGYTQHTLGLYLMGQYMWNPALGEAGLSALRDRWLERAFGPGGVGHEYPKLRSRALHSSYTINSHYAAESDDWAWSAYCAACALRYAPSDRQAWKSLVRALLARIGFVARR